MALMPLQDPTKPWVAVLMRLGGTTPSRKAHDTIAGLFRTGALGGFGLADYWSDQTLGAVDVSGSTVTEWEPCDWDIYSYPGRHTSFADHRGWLTDQARKRVPDLGRYRGIVSVFNFVCNGGSDGPNMVWGLNGYDSTPAWGDSSWVFCSKCLGILRAAPSRLLAPYAIPCPTGGTHSVPRGRHYITVSDSSVPQLRTLDRCVKCGLLYASDLPRTRTRPRLAPYGGASMEAVECAAGGGHFRSGETTQALSRWADPPAEREFGTCHQCRLVLHDDADGAPCPTSSRGHQVEKTILAFPSVELRLEGGRGFMAHEMGHGYGLDHGRGIEPRSHNLGNDSWPGAYGDPSDMMSFGNVHAYSPVAGDPDAQLGRRGPGLAVHQLLNFGLIDSAHVRSFDPAQPGPQHQTLRPVHEPRYGPRLRPIDVERRSTASSAGIVAARFDRYVAEFRVRDGRWDAGLDTGSAAPGMVRVYHEPVHDPSDPDFQDLYVLVPSTSGRSFLAEGDTFETRLGLGNSRLTVEEITRIGARLRLEPLPQQPGSRSFQRWLVIPCRHADSKRTFDLGAVRSTVGAVEDYWNAMAAGAFSVRGAYVLATGIEPSGNDPVILPWTMAQDAGISAVDRVKRSVEAALSMPNPNRPDNPERLWMDWRWFTGIIILKTNGRGARVLRGSPLQLPSGRLPSGKADGHRLPELPYDVIEMSLSEFSQAALARSIGRTLGFGDANDGYDLMGPASEAQYTSPVSAASFGSPDWGGTGPGLGSGSLKRKGWLPDALTQVIAMGAEGEESPKVGTIELSPLHRRDAPREGVVRADLGPYHFELRVPAGWDSGIPKPVVLARDSAGQVTALELGGHIGWGDEIMDAAGGGRVTVTSLSAERATLSYYVRQGPVFAAGGGRLTDGGTFLIGATGQIHRIPHGDPLEGRAEELIAQLERMAAELRGR